MSNPTATATQFAPTAPLHAPSTASRALLAYGIGAGALGLLALGALLVYRRRLRWKRSREKRMSFGIDHDGGSDDSGADKFDGAAGAAGVPLMSLPSSSDEQSRSRSRSRTTSITFAPLPVPEPRDSAFFYDPPPSDSAAGISLSLNDPLPPPRSPNGAAAVHTHYTAAPHLPALAESRESHRMSDTTTSPRTYDAPPPASSNVPPLPSSNAPPPLPSSNAPPPPSSSNAPPLPSSSNEPPPLSSPTAHRI